MLKVTLILIDSVVIIIIFMFWDVGYSTSSSYLIFIGINNNAFYHIFHSLNSFYFIYHKFVKQYGQNALHWAALNGRFEIVQLIMASGADIKMKSKVSTLFVEIRQVFVSLMIYLPVCLSVYLPVCLSVYLSVYLSVCLQFVCLSVCLCVSLSAVCLSICLSAVCLCMRLPTCLYMVLNVYLFSSLIIISLSLIIVMNQRSKC